MEAESLPSLKLRAHRETPLALPVTYWRLALPSAAESPGMRMPQVEKKLAPGKLWTKERDQGKMKPRITPGLSFPGFSREPLLGP